MPTARSEGCRYVHAGVLWLLCWAMAAAGGNPFQPKRVVRKLVHAGVDSDFRELRLNLRPSCSLAGAPPLSIAKITGDIKVSTMGNQALVWSKYAWRSAVRCHLINPQAFGCATASRSSMGKITVQRSVSVRNRLLVFIACWRWYSPAIASGRCVCEDRMMRLPADMATGRAGRPARRHAPD